MQASRSGSSLRGAGIDLSTLTRFMPESADGHRDIRLERTAGRLFAYLRLKIAETGGTKQPAAETATRRAGKKKS